MIKIIKESPCMSDGVAVKKIAMEINIDELAKADKKKIEAILGANILKSIEDFEALNGYFRSEYIDENGCLAWRDCNNIRGVAFTAKELTEKLTAKS